MSVLKRLEELSEKATPRPWRAPISRDRIVRIVIEAVGGGLTSGGNEEVGYGAYSRHWVAEILPSRNAAGSDDFVWTEGRRAQEADAAFIVAAVNALPDLLRVVRAAQEHLSTPWDGFGPAIQTSRKLHAALEALTKEEPE